MHSADIEIPQEHGEAAVAPPFEQWSGVMAANQRAVQSWDAVVAGVPLRDLRSQARREALAAAAVAAERMDGISAPEPDEDAPIVLTGHQPLLYHPGVWAKVMLADRLASESGGTAIECIVDSDAFERIALVAPCAEPRVDRCSISLVDAPASDAYFASAPAPDQRSIEEFSQQAHDVLATLPIPGAAEAFAVFERGLAAQTAARDAAEAVTAARRAYEDPLKMSYLPLPITDEGACPAFGRFCSDLAFDAARFREIHNAALAAYRAARRVRSAARPFPDLRADSGAVELPLWHLDGQTRASVWAISTEQGVDIVTRGSSLLTLESRADPLVLQEEAGGLAPRAVALTMFNRVLVADLFVHGAGGAAYEEVTDDIIREYWGFEPPGFAAATLTVRLPVESPQDPEGELADLRQRLHRLEHNPDQMLGDPGVTAGMSRDAASLAETKAGLVARIAAPDADKKALGEEIRQLNEGMSSVLEPLVRDVRAEIERLERVRMDALVLSDRTYPFCLWDPLAVREHLLPTA